MGPPGIGPAITMPPRCMNIYMNPQYGLLRHLRAPNTSGEPTTGPTSMITLVLGRDSGR